jgi:SAM-dependent methyltransferase
MMATSVDSQVIHSPKEQEEIQQALSVYACPTCKGQVELSHDGLHCRVCAVTYPILNGIPDFIVEKLEQSGNFSLRMLRKWDSSFLLNLAAYSYETCIYPPVCNLYGGWRCTSLKQLAHYVSDIVGSRDGLILDVACGPGTYGRRIASPSRAIYGIDACMSMLRRGARYVERGNLPNVHFARAKVEALPFPAGLFDAAICAGSLNHFSNTVLALREINRTMKAGAPLAVMCFAAGSKGLFKYKSLRERAERRGGHIFELPDLDRYVAQAGFEDFRPHLYGSILVFSARKGWPNQIN